MADNMRDMTLNLIVNSQVGKLKDFNKNLKNTENSIDRTTKKTGWLSRNLGRIFVAYFGIQGVKNMVHTYRNLDLVRRSIEGLTKSTQDWEYIQREAFRTGTGIETVAKGYRNFYSAASMAGFDKTGIQSMYSDILVSSRAIGASQQQVQGALLALEQMLSKGKVSMEELRRQLGNALPGAFEIGAKAMGVTTQKFNDMVKAGISANEFVPKFTKELLKTYEKAFPEAIKSLDYALVNLDTSWKMLQYDLFRGGAGQELAKVIKQITSVLTSSELRTAIFLISKSLNVIMQILSYLLKHLKQILFIISPLVFGAAIDKLIKSVAILVGWIRAGNLALSMTQRWMLLIFAGIVMLDEIIALFQKGRKSIIKTVLFGDDFSTADKIIGALTIIAATLITIGTALSIINKFKMPFANKNIPTTNIAETSKVSKGSLIDRINQANKAVDKKIAAEANKAKISKMVKTGTKVAKSGARGLSNFIKTNPFVDFLFLAGASNLKMQAGESPDWYKKYGLQPNVGGGLQPVSPQLSKTETYAPNVTYNPQYYIDATGLTPEELRDVLDERDRNFWTSLNRGKPSMMSKGNGYSSLFPYTGGGQF